MRAFSVSLCILAFLAFVPAARAERVLDHYDIDSLAYRATAIVRAQVGDSKPHHTVDGDFIQFNVTVTDVFKGPIASGATIGVTGLDEFQRAPGMPGHADSWNPIQKGDSAYLFLVPNDNRTGYAMYRFGDAKWQVIESGARLLDGKSVYSFVQFLPRNFPVTQPARKVWDGFVAMTRLTAPGSSPMTRQAFEDRLKKSQKTIAQLEQLLAAPATPKTGDQIIAFLQERSRLLADERANSDALSPKLVDRLAATSTPAKVMDLLDGSPENTRWALGLLLESSFGRGYLQAIEDNRQTSPHRRMQCQTLLAEARESDAQTRPN